MTTKADMICRQKDLLDSLNNNTFNKQQFLKKHKILDRTLRRDLNALAERGEIFEERLGYLRKKCLGNLTQKAHDGKLSDGLMYSIVMSGVTQKAEIRTDITEKKEYTVKIDSLNPDERSFLNAVARKYIKANNTTESASIH